MQIKSITVKNFRNYANQKVEFGDGLNIFKGENGSGKTNLLEAVYLAGVGKSPRTTNEKELIKLGEERAFIKAVIKKNYRSHIIEIAIDKQGKKILIDGIPALKATELIGILNVIQFSPDEIKFVREAPQERRKFMDIALSQQSQAYFRTLIKYNHILKQRNKLLKDEWNNRELDLMLAVWDTQLAEEGSKIILKRKEFLSELSPLANDMHRKLSDGKEQIELIYESDVEGETLDELNKNQLEKYKQNLEKDKNLQYTTSGAHRDDIKIILNGNDARKIASQGQQRTTALSILLAELQLFKKETGELPVLLLDDVLSELDGGRRQALLEVSNSVQTLLTCTDFNEKTNAERTAVFNVKNGSISK